MAATRCSPGRASGRGSYPIVSDIKKLTLILLLAEVVLVHLEAEVIRITSACHHALVVWVHAGFLLRFSLLVLVAEPALVLRIGLPVGHVLIHLIHLSGFGNLLGCLSS